MLSNGERDCLQNDSSREVPTRCLPLCVSQHGHDLTEVSPLTNSDDKREEVTLAMVFLCLFGQCLHHFPSTPDDAIFNPTQSTCSLHMGQA